jgi:hypothetical protein
VADRVEVGVNPWSILVLAPSPSRIRVEGATIEMHSLRASADTLAPEPEDDRRPGAIDHLPRFRAMTENLIRALTAHAEQLPHVSLRDVQVLAQDEEGEKPLGARLDSLEWVPAGDRARLEASGTVTLEDQSPFRVRLDRTQDGRIAGRVEFDFASGRPLVLTVNGRLAPEPGDRGLRLVHGSQILVGSVPIETRGLLSRNGPRISFGVAMSDVPAARVRQSLPPELLGPLQDVDVLGSFDYRIDFDLDFARPDSLRFRADVTSHGLRLGPDTRLRLKGLEEPFTAVIHLPHNRLVARELSLANSGYRPLDEIDPALAYAVVTNEDGGFFHHRGFNTDAFRDALIENLHAGRYRRGAGTITMQLARNLYLGHERKLARKGQEIVLAWILEHLTGVSKQRLLEIYLNIIEWGPGVHGADEATRYYFGHGAGQVSVPEALFLATVVPAPQKWRYRFDSNGELRPFEKAQMHFIGRAMIRKGWLAPELLPEAEELRVELRGPARDVLFPTHDSSMVAAPAGVSPAIDVGVQPAAPR